MSRSPGMLAAFILRRMGYSRQLLACILVAIVIITALVTALANFAARALPAAASQQLVSASGTTIQVSSSSVPASPGPADRLIASAMRSTFGDVGFGVQRAIWSDPLNLPTPAGASAIWTGQVASMTAITGHARLVTGAWPADPTAGEPVGVAIPAADAGPLRMRVGQTLRLVDGVNQHPALLRVTGLYQPLAPASGYWGLDLLSPSGITVQTGFRTFGPFIAQPAALTTGQLAPTEVSWLVTPDVQRIHPGQMPGVQNRLQSALSRLSQAQLSASTGLPQLLSGIGTSYNVSRSLLAMSALELLLVAAAAMALTARLLAAQRADEGALLDARGLTRRQLSLLSLAEALVVVMVSAVAGAVIGNLLAGPLESGGVLRAERQHLPAGAAAWWPALAVAVLALIILAWPAVVPAAATVAARRGRQPTIALISRAGVDVALIALAVVTGWQLRRYSVIARGASGSLGIDPVLVAAPPLILLGAALVPLRAVPAAARLGDRLSARGRRLVSALATWEISRRPVRQAGPALLAILAVGTGTLALAQAKSWTESVHAQAASQVGADIRVDLPSGAQLASASSVLGGPVVRAAMPVSVFDGGLGGQMVALDSREAARVVLLRPDQASVPAPALWRMLRPKRTPGLPVPGRPARLAVMTRVSAAAPSWDLSALAVTVSVQAADGVVYALPAGSLRADGTSQRLVADVPAAARVSAPLRLLGFDIGYQMPGYSGRGAATKALARHQITLTIGSLSAGGPTGSFPAPFATGAALAGWRHTAVSATLADNNDAAGKQPAVVSWEAAGTSGLTMTFEPGYGHLITKQGEPPVPIDATVTSVAPVSSAPVAAIATTSFLASADDVAGAAVNVAVGNARIPVTIVAAIKSFPTAGAAGVLIMDQSSLQAAVAARSAPPLPVTSWWLSTANGQMPHGLPAAEVTSLRQVNAQMQANLLSAAPQRAVLGLFIAVALLALLGFSVSVAASISERRARSALLSALGVTRTAQARQLCLEQLLLALPAAAAGLLVGIVIAHLLVPAVTITEQATLPVPPALVYVPAGWALALAAIVAATPMVVAAFTLLRKPDPAAELRAAGTT